MKRNSELVGLCQSSYWANGKWNKTMDWILNWFFSYCFVVVVVCCVMGSDSGMKVDWEEKIEIFLSKKCLWFHSAGWDLQNFPFFVVFVVVVVCWVCVNVHYGCGGAIEHKILPTNQIQTESTFLPLSLSPSLSHSSSSFFTSRFFFGENADYETLVVMVNKREYVDYESTCCGEDDLLNWHHMEILTEIQQQQQIMEKLAKNCLCEEPFI